MKPLPPNATKPASGSILMKKQLRLWSAAALILCMVGVGMARAGATNWQLFTSSDDGFSVSVPSQPTFQRVTRGSEAGPLELHVYQVNVPTAALMISVLDLPKPSKPVDVMQVLQGGLESSLKGTNSRLLRQNNIVIDGYHGIEYEAESATLHFSTRTFLVGTKSYSALVTSAVGNPYGETRRFLESFHLPPVANH